MISLASLLISACAAPAPMEVNPSFVDRSAPKPVATTAVRNCRLNIVTLTDDRRAPEMLGIVGGRAVKTPGDTQAWLRSVVNGLSTRGFTVDFSQNGTTGSGAVVASISLRTAWVTDVSITKDASVVFHVVASRAGSPTLERDYRGYRVHC